MTPEKLCDCLPILLPQTCNIEFHGITLRGISRYPVDEWMRQNKPVMTARMWVLLVKSVAEQDMENLAGVFEKAEQLLAKGVPQPGYS